MSIINKIRNALSIKKNLSTEVSNGNVSLDSLMLNNLSFGDVILARRYNSLNEKEKFKKGHDVGFYVVVGKTDSKLICCYCTSVEGKLGFFPLGEDYIIFNNKKTFVTVCQNKTIDNFSFIKKVGSLNFEDKEKLIKNLKFHNSFYNDSGEMKKLDLVHNPKISIRDVIKINGVFYLVIDIDDNNFKILQLDNYDKDSCIIDFSKNSFDYNKVYLVDIKHYNYVNTIPKKQYAVIIKEYCKHKRRVNELQYAKNNKILNRGYIIKYNDKLYYVYNITASLASAFEIVMSNSDDAVMVGKRNFVACFDNEVNINIKNDIYDVIAIANDNEMELFSSDRKKYFNNKKIENKELVKRKKGHNFNVGDIIESTEIYGMKFIVIGMYNDTIITISLDHFIDDNKVIYREFSNYNGSLDLSNNINKELLTKVRKNIIYFDALSDEVKFKKRKREKKK